MNKFIIIFLSFFTLGVFSQKNSKKKDTVKTEVVEIETKYNPKIADAKKIMQQPKVSVLKESKKRKLNYTIFSVPVASTFIPKTGSVKGIDVGVKERIYNNFVALGYGNYNSPYAELYLHHNARFNNAFGAHLRYNASFDNIGNTILNSGFSETYSNIFYQQEERYFDWKLGLTADRRLVNWYGLPSLNFSQQVINRIDEEQQYNKFNLNGELHFKDSKIDFVSVDLQYFNDRFGSSEAFGSGIAKFIFPVDFLVRNYNEMSITTGLDYLIGGFEQRYSSTSALTYQFLNLKAIPKYDFSLGDMALEMGVKLLLSFDIQNSLQHFLVYPDVKLQFPIVKETVSVYGGVTGGLHTNSYQELAWQNPFVSPTLFMTQTNEKINFFAGISALIDNNLSLHFKASRKSEEDKALFARNNSKSDGTSSLFNGNPLNGYEFGNSFGVIFDDVISSTFLAEIEFEPSKQLSLLTSLRYSIYETTNSLEAWNLAPFESTLLAKYKHNKWYATATLTYIADRKDILYSSSFPSSVSGVQTIKGFLDAHVNGGYHFNDKFTVFLQVNNVINGNYQQFTNFNVQGFQAIAGLSYKFDF